MMNLPENILLENPYYGLYKLDDYNLRADLINTITNPILKKNTTR